MPGTWTRAAPALAVVAASIGLAGSAGASGTSGASELRRVQLGILGDADRFQELTGQRSTIRHMFLGWSSRKSWQKILEPLRPVPMLAVSARGRMAPLNIANGDGDAFLVELNGAIAEFGSLFYVRPMPEMNGHWNAYSAYNRDGSTRGPRYSTAAFKKAFARIAILVRGGSKAELNRQLRKLGLLGFGGDLPRTKARLVWNPQGYGSPDLPGNSAQAYYPGDAYVDVVANDLYLESTGAAWDANEALYRAHPDKPYAIAEWGLWGIDDPSFVERMATFVRTHPRVEFVSYFNSKPGSTWDLQSKPRSRAAYRRSITPLGR